MLTKMLEPSTPVGPNQEQIRYWNDVAGASWVALEPRLSAQIRPFGERALSAAVLKSGERVLDIGCGGGDTTLSIARQVGPSGAVTGVDICEPLLSLAARRVADAGLENVSFLLADAQTAELPEGAFDVVSSRFGVMFFADPGAAFRNLYRSLAPGGRLSFACWRAPHENAWMSIPLDAVRAHLPLPPFDPHAPGPCSLADADRTRGLLEAAGFTDVLLTAWEHAMSYGQARTVEEAVDFLFQVGPVTRALREADPSKAEPVRQSLRTALQLYAGEEGVSLGGAAWIVTAHR